MSDKKASGEQALPQPEKDELPIPPENSPASDGLVAPPPIAALPNQPNVYDPRAPLPERPLPSNVHGPVPQHLKIAEGVLRKAAGKADEVYDVLHKQTSSLENPTNRAAQAIQGLHTKSALRQSIRRWEEQAGVVTAWIAHISESLRVAADSYDKNEKETEGSFRGMEPGHGAYRSPISDF